MDPDSDPFEGLDGNWSEQESTDTWTGQHAPNVPGWGEDATPRSRRRQPDPLTDPGQAQQPAQPYPPLAPEQAAGSYPAADPYAQPPGYPGQQQAYPGQQPPGYPAAPQQGPPQQGPHQQGLHGPGDEPTWASAALGMEQRPAPRRPEPADEPTWAGTSLGMHAETEPRHGQPEAHYAEPHYAEPDYAEADPRRAAPGPDSPDAAPPGGDSWLRLDEEPGGSWRSRAAKAATPFRRRKGGAGKRSTLPMVIAGIVVLALLAGVGYWVWAVGPLAPEEDKNLAGVTVSGVISRVEQQGFTCIRGRNIVHCEDDKSVKGADLGVSIHFTGEGEVTKLEASGGTEAYSNDEATPEELRGFFEMAAGLPLKGGAAAEAKAWAGDHVGKSGTATFGGVAYDFSADQTLLTMTRA